MGVDASFAAYKAVQKQSWSLFAPLEAVTTIPAASLVKFAAVQRGERLLDVGCGTGVVALTAAARGAKVVGLDLSPALLERAATNAALAGLSIAYDEGDVEALPYEDSSFDLVLSQFGHMFAPRPEIAVQEMLRVLRPGGRIAFSTWPPEMFMGKLFALVARYMPPPNGVASPPAWGDPSIVRQRLGEGCVDLLFQRDVMRFPALSVGHYRQSVETTVGPVLKLVEASKSDPELLENFHKDLEAIVRPYYESNYVHQDFLMSRAIKRP